MNYRHAFHAGNFADVFKHVFLTRILEYLKRKETPFRYIDTHAGIGSYNLASEEARRTGEWREGIARLLNSPAPDTLQPLLQPYLEIVREGLLDSLEGGTAGRYPGSPALAQSLLRSQDRMIFCELHPADRRRLTRHSGRDKRIKVIEIDGYMALRAYVPPVERRGLVLIDPPFEKTGEFATLARKAIEAWKKWPTGVYCIWYPVKDEDAVDDFYKELGKSGMASILRLELSVGQIGAKPGLVSNGLAVINPPYVLKTEAEELLPYLLEVLAQDDQAQWRIEDITVDTM
jgi:23S rRNA (adenine2030-N6)-methyltransferase